MATHSSILGCRIPWIEEPGGGGEAGWCATVPGVTKSQTGLSDQHFPFFMSELMCWTLRSHR